MAREERCLRPKFGQSMVFNKTVLGVDNAITSWDCGWRMNAFFPAFVTDKDPQQLVGLYLIKPKPTLSSGEDR